MNLADEFSMPNRYALGRHVTSSFQILFCKRQLPGYCCNSIGATPPKKYCKRTCVTRVTSFWHTLGLQMTKTELLIAIAQATETNRRTAGVFLETLSALAYKEIKKNGEFVLPGFGKLVKQKRKARTGFNPKTQQKIKIPAKTVVKFRVAKAAKDAVLGLKK